jgi:hypothetical protein
MLISIICRNTKLKFTKCMMRKISRNPDISARNNKFE